MTRISNAASKALLLIAITLTLGACAATGADDGFANDPYEQTNRDVHEFNRGVDTVVVRPAARAYQEAVPGTVKLMVSNALDMLDMPAIFVNRVLQGDPERALAAAGRFGINVVLGGGVLDPATEFGLPKESTDLGVTFAKWGVEEGPYVELPLLGPATARDAVGRVAEIALDPFNFVTGVPALEAVGYATLPLGVVDLRADNLDAIDRVLYEAPDSYVATRTGYLQLRRRQVEGGPTAESLPDVFSE